MFCRVKSPCGLIAGLLIAGLLVSHLVPVSKLATRPANDSPVYSAAWKEGCESGISSSSTLKVMISKKPFIHQGESASTAYRNAWNEGYTSCRFAQEGVDRWIQIALLMITLLFIYRAGTQKGECSK